MDRNDTVLYVGQSKNLSARIRSHISRKSNIKDQPLFEEISKVGVLFFDKDCLVENEVKYIAKYIPKFNGVMGGAREGAGRPPVNCKLKNWVIRVHEHEKPLVKVFLKKLRASKESVKDDNK
jgi:excinuclease UvrABC nuclease subunit